MVTFCFCEIVDGFDLWEVYLNICFVCLNKLVLLMKHTASKAIVKNILSEETIKAWVSSFSLLKWLDVAS